MIVLLPPSETKAVGGSAGSVFDPAELSFPSLAKARTRVMKRAIADAKRAKPAATAVRQRWIDENKTLSSAPVMPAIERYTGVLYDAIGAATIDDRATEWLEASVVISSALFGFVRAGDLIPSYKLPHSALTGELRGVWRGAGDVIDDALVVDLRSKAYVALAPVPGSVPVDVVGTDAQALNHWNKHGKGVLVRELARLAVTASSVDELLAATTPAGIPLTRTDSGLQLVADPS